MKRLVKAGRDPLEDLQNTWKAQKANRAKKQEIKAKLFDLVCDNVYGYSPEEIIQRIMDLPDNLTIDDIFYDMRTQKNSFLDSLEALENSYIDPKDLY